MAGVSDTGFETKTVAEIIEDVANRAKSTEYYGEDFPVTPDSVFGVLNSIIAASIADGWNLGQAVADTGNRDTAEGVYLDYLASIVGIQRLQETGSSGELLFEGLQGTSIPQNFVTSNADGDKVLTNVSFTLNRASCYKTKINVVTVNNTEDYTVTVGANTYTYTSDADATELEILNGLEVAITSDPDVTVSIIGSTTLVIENINKLNTLSTTNTPNLGLESVSSLINSTSAQPGPISFPANSITTLVSISLEVVSVTNLLDFTEGTYRETDEELRLRMATQGQSAGTATKPSIEAALSSINGVSGALVQENITLVTDVNNVPPKAYETFVTGGDEDEIAEIIWTTKPAAIETYGDISKQIIDQNGDIQDVKFSRPTNVYAHMRVTYSLNPEESTPADFETSMKDVEVIYGDNMYSGEDYEPTKFYSPLYTIPGIFIDLIEIDTTPNPGDTPTFGTSRITVDKTEALLFDASRIIVTV